jgi:hypothetical protein
MIVGGLVAIVVAIVAIGYLLPQRHVATRERTYRATPEVVYAAIVARTSFDDVQVVIDEAVPSKRVVTRIADKTLPFGGSWTYELSPATEGTRLSITENGEVYNPFFRFMSRFVLGHAATIDKYMDDLERRVTTASR